MATAHAFHDARYSSLLTQATFVGAPVGKLDVGNRLVELVRHAHYYWTKGKWNNEEIVRCQNMNMRSSSEYVVYVNIVSLR